MEALFTKHLFIGFGGSFTTHQPRSAPKFLRNSCLPRAQEQAANFINESWRVSRRGLILPSLCILADWQGKTGPVFAQETDKITEKVFLDIAIDGNPAGRIVIGIYGDLMPLAAARFADLASGINGISYRRKEFSKVMKNYIQNAGLKSFSLSGEVSTSATFSSANPAEDLIKEWNSVDPKNRAKNEKGAVSLVLFDPTKPAAKPKLIARDGKFEIVKEEARADPNGTEFTIAIADAPELDSTNVVVGKVLEGLDVVENIASVRVVQDNNASPYFRVAKLIGDTRAVVAEKSFNRPYSKVIISKSGRLNYDSM